MHKKSMTALMGIILFVIVFVIVLAMYLQIKIYAQGTATSSTCSFTGSLRSFQNKGPIDLVMPETKLACQPYDYGELTKFGKDDLDIQNNYMKQIADMTYDCSNEFDFGENNVWLRAFEPKIHCFPCYSFYLPEDSEGILNIEYELFLEEYEVKKDGKKYTMAELLAPISMPVMQAEKDYFISEVSLPFTDAVFGSKEFFAATIIVDVGLFIYSGGTSVVMKSLAQKALKETAEVAARKSARSWVKKQARKEILDIQKSALSTAAKREALSKLKKNKAELIKAGTEEIATSKIARNTAYKELGREIGKSGRDLGFSEALLVYAVDSLVDNKGVEYEVFDEIEPKEDYTIVFISKAKSSRGSYEPGIGDDGNYVVITKTKDFSKLNCQNEND